MNEKQSGNILRIFPLFIYKIKIGLTESERNILIKEVYEQETKSKNRLLRTCVFYKFIDLLHRKPI